MKKIQKIPYLRITTTERNNLIKVVINQKIYNTDIQALQEFNGVNWITIEDKTVIVSQLEDFPTASGGVITLAVNTTYSITTQIDIGTSYLQLQQGTNIIGTNSFVAKLTYTGTGAMLRSVDASFSIRKIFLQSSNNMFEFTNTARNKHIIFNDIAVIAAGNIGVITGYGAVSFDTCNYINSTELHVKDIKNLMFVRQFMNISANMNYDWDSDEVTEVGVGETVIKLGLPNSGIGYIGYIYKNITSSIIEIDGSTDYTANLDWEVINKKFLVIDDTVTDSIYKIQATHCKFLCPEGYIGISGNASNINIAGIITFVGNIFDGSGIYIDKDISIEDETKIKFISNINLTSPICLPKKTTSGLNGIGTPGIGNLFFNTTEDKVAVYTSDGWELLDSSILAINAFTADFETGLDGFVLTNNGTNNWIRGVSTSSEGSYSLYISNDGTNAVYNKSNSEISHAHIDIPLPAGATSAQLLYDWKCVGEVGYDYGRVYDAPTSVTPSAGTLPNSSYSIGQANYNNNSVWTTESIDIDVANAGTTRRFIFSWRNDGSAGGDPGFCIDNVKLNYTL